MNAKKLIMPDIYGKGALFAYSALDGQTDYDADFVLTLEEKPVSFRIETKVAWHLSFPLVNPEFSAVTNDMIEAKTVDGDFFITFLSSDVVCGISPVCPTLKIGEPLNGQYQIVLPDLVPAVHSKKIPRGYAFAVSLKSNAASAKLCAEKVIDFNLEEIKKERYSFYQNLPVHNALNNNMIRLYNRACSGLKCTVHSPQGNIPARWTTPDRVPHRNMWLWDSVFHALGFKELDGGLAEDVLYAVLSQIREDGMIPISMSPHIKGEITQPPVLAWGVWEVYKKTKNRAFLKKCAEPLKAYLEWDMKNRDSNGNRLLEWHIEAYENCRSGESGMDNSPRFDNALCMDAVDFSVFLANEFSAMGNILSELGEQKGSDYYAKNFKELKDSINDLLWSEEDGFYFDKRMDGGYEKVFASSGFLPMFAGICDESQANRLVERLKDESQFMTPMPIPSISCSGTEYSTDMWRGGVWINITYLIILGLQKYGYCDLAKIIIEKTLSCVNGWYEKTGAMYEFYDANNLLPPYKLHRKGKPHEPFDWRKTVHSISDFGWTNALIMLMLAM